MSKKCEHELLELNEKLKYHIGDVLVRYCPECGATVREVMSETIDEMITEGKIIEDDKGMLHVPKKV